MNFLAHAYLSFNDPEVLTGNLISDFVKGKKKFGYPVRILGGINLHRAIDDFTDNHPVTKEAGRYFKPDYGLYSSAFIDVVYDHFLALHITHDLKQDLKVFSSEVYEQLFTYNHLFPDSFADLYPYMKKYDWLYNYQFLWGIEKSFEGLVRRAAYLSKHEPAMKVLQANYERFEDAFDTFFPQLRQFSRKIC